MRIAYRDIIKETNAQAGKQSQTQEKLIFPEVIFSHVFTHHAQSASKSLFCDQ